MSPKYVLKLAGDRNVDCPWTIYENAIVGGELMERADSYYDNLEEALKFLFMKTGEPVIIAWSSQEVE